MLFQQELAAAHPVFEEQTFSRRRFLAAIGLAALAGCSSAPSGAEAPHREPSLLDLAKTDPIALLQRCLKNYADQKITDYTGTFTKQERIRGKLGKQQEAEFKFREHPFSVALHFTQNSPAGERLLFEEGKGNGYVLILPHGTARAWGPIARKPDDFMLRRSSLKPITEFGLRNCLEAQLKAFERAKKAGDLTHEFGGEGQVDGRATLKIVRILPNKEPYECSRVEIQIDRERLLPVMIEGWNHDKEPAFSYRFTNLKINPGLKDTDFTPENNGFVEEDRQ